MTATDVIQDDALTELLKIGDRLHESMGTELDGTDFKNAEIESLVLLSASTVHLIAELRAARTSRDEAQAAVDVAVAAERERIAAAIEAEAQTYPRDSMVQVGFRDAARIARSTTDGGDADDSRRRSVLFNDITHAPREDTAYWWLSDRQLLADYLWTQGWRRDVRPEDVTETATYDGYGAPIARAGGDTDD